MRFFISVHAKVANVGTWDKLEKPIDHAKSRAKNGDEAKRIGINDGLNRFFNRSLDLHVVGREFAKRFESFNNGDFLDNFAELVRLGFDAANLGDFVLEQRMIQHVDVFHIGYIH